jgi:uncharacterized membrane protein YedE/YeeE
MSFATWFGLACLAGLALMVWSSFRSAPDTRSRAEQLRSGLRLRNELANTVGVIAALLALLGAAAEATWLAIAAAGLIALAFLLAWCADRREHKAEQLEHPKT